MNKLHSIIICTSLLLCGCTNTPSTNSTNNEEPNANNATEVKQETEVTQETWQEAHLNVEWAQGTIDNAEVFIASTQEPQANVLFKVDNKIRDFKVLSLTFINVDDNGKVQFDTKELYSLDQLTPEKPFNLKCNMIGSIPNIGVSYTDYQGNTRRFSLQESGEDGSALLSEF